MVVLGTAEVLDQGWDGLQDAVNDETAQHLTADTCGGYVCNVMDLNIVRGLRSRICRKTNDATSPARFREFSIWEHVKHDAPLRKSDLETVLK